MKYVATIILVISYAAAAVGTDAHLMAVGTVSKDWVVRVSVDIGWPALLVGYVLNELDHQPAKVTP